MLRPFARDRGAGGGEQVFVVDGVVEAEVVDEKGRRSVHAAANAAAEIVAQFPKTAMLVSIISPRYIESEWCTREVSEFCKSAEQIPQGLPSVTRCQTRVKGT